MSARDEAASVAADVAACEAARLVWCDLDGADDDDCAPDCCYCRAFVAGWAGVHARPGYDDGERDSHRAGRRAARAYRTKEARP